MGFFGREEGAVLSLTKSLGELTKFAWEWIPNLASMEGGLSGFFEPPENVWKLAFLCTCAFIW